MKRARCAAAVAAMALSCATAAPAWAQGAGRDITLEAMRGEKRVALVIGDGAYPTAPLRNPVNDARAMAQALRGVGFEVLAHENLSQKDMLRAVIEFGDRLAGGGVGLFYFSGHGLQVGGRNYMIPTDAAINSEKEVEVESVDVARVLARMDGAQNRLNIVILDACRDNPFGRSFRTGARGLASIDAPSGTIIAYATAPRKLARDGEGRHGLYTGEPLKAIPVPGLKIEDVFKQVRQAVQNQTRGEQVPWEASSLVGDFMFTLPAVVSVTPPPPPPPPPRLEVDDGGEMVLVPAGEFWMGSDIEGGADEKPRHRVYLGAYYIDKYETANALYGRLLEATGRAASTYWRDSKFNGATQPVAGVTWHDADAYCRWAGKRLPTEAEWEKASRGTDGRKYPWGNEWDSSRANSDESRLGKPAPVGSYPSGVSPYGVHDMAGNVWEWVADWYEKAYYRRSPERNPSGPDSGQYRVLRGGAWDDVPIALRSAGRYGNSPDIRDDNVGFRCARGLP